VLSFLVPLDSRSQLQSVVIDVIADLIFAKSDDKRLFNVEVKKIEKYSIFNFNFVFLKRLLLLVEDLLHKIKIEGFKINLKYIF